MAGIRTREVVLPVKNDFSVKNCINLPLMMEVFDPKLVLIGGLGLQK